MAQVKIDSDIWDLICEHYASMDPREYVPGDEIVVQYITDKINKQVKHECYMSNKRLDGYQVTTGQQG